MWEPRSALGALASSFADHIGLGIPASTAGSDTIAASTTGSGTVSSRAAPFVCVYFR
jgi:hypothetical protein